MKTREYITVDMIPEFALSSPDSLMVKANSVFDMLLKGMNESAVYKFCRTTPEEVKPYEAAWMKMHKIDYAPVG